MKQLLIVISAFVFMYFDVVGTKWIYGRWNSDGRKR